MKAHPKIKRYQFAKGIQPLKKSTQWDKALCCGLFFDNDTSSVSLSFENQTYDISGPMSVEEFCRQPYMKDKCHTVFLTSNPDGCLWKLFDREYFSIRKGEHPALRKYNTKQFPYCVLAWKGKHMHFIDKNTFFPESLETYQEMFGISDPRILLERLCKELQNLQQPYEIPITHTRGKMANKVLRTQYLKQPFPLANNDLLHFMIQCTHGAVAISYCRGFDTSKKWYMYDRNGLYCEAMQKVILPYSCIDRTKFLKITNKIYKEEYMGWALVSFSFPKHVRAPCLPAVKDKLLFPRTGISYCTFYDIRLAKKLGARMQFLDGFCWRIQKEDRNHPFKAYAEHLMQKKDNAVRKLQEMPKDAHAFLHKYFSKQQYTSLFGITGQKYWDKEAYHAGTMYNPGIQSLILSKARTIMLEFVNTYHSAYTHTDSLLVPQPLPKDITGLYGYTFKHETPKGCYPFLIRPGLYALFDPETYRLLKYGHHSVEFSGSWGMSEFIESLQKDFGKDMPYGDNRSCSFMDDGRVQYNEVLPTIESLRDLWTDSEPIESVHNIYNID